MATVIARMSEAGSLAYTASVATAQAGNGVSTNIIDRGPSHKAGIVRITTTVGATPTCTYALEVSKDGATWVAATWADVATPTVTSSATFVITTATTVQRIIKQPAPWRFVRVTMSANTNTTSTIDLLFNDSKTLLS